MARQETYTDKVQQVLYDIEQEIYDIRRDLETGMFSNEEIAERLLELENKLS